MPYIKDRRDDVDLKTDHLNIETTGELNYVLTMVASQYAKTHGRNYQVFNDIIGAFECAKQELYRRRIAPYEDLKIEENGDVAF